MAVFESEASSVVAVVAFDAALEAFAVEVVPVGEAVAV